MGFARRAKRFLNSIVFKRCGCELLPSSLVYDWQRYPHYKEGADLAKLPEGAKNYLQPNNPRIKELNERYAKFDDEVTVPLVWKEGHVRPEDLRCFRGDNAYVWQLRGINMNIMAYALTAYYVKAIDELGLLQQLQEDDYFGNYNFFIDNKKISRDLLDSITEIYFLYKHLTAALLGDLTILDIGAGYGRLAHRMVQAFPNITYFCTDAIAISTFICEYYLRFRKLESRAKVISLDNIEGTLKNYTVDIAINVHSFSECSIPSIEWWLSLLRKYRIRYLMIVPNALDHGGKRLLTVGRQDIGQIIEKHGYKLIVKEPKFRDPIIQKYAICPTYYYLFELF